MVNSLGSTPVLLRDSANAIWSYVVDLTDERHVVVKYNALDTR